MISATGQSLPTASPEETGLSSARLARIDEVMLEHVRSGRLAGASGLIARNGKILFRRSWGEFKDDTIVRIWSMGKVITGVAALALFEEGKLSLDDPVSKYLPEFAQMTVAQQVTDSSGKRIFTTVPAERPITILDLLRHTSGLSYGGPRDETGLRAHEKVGIVGFPPVLPFNLAEFTKRLATAPLEEQPGTTFHYGRSIDVLGRVIEVLSAKPLDVFLSEKVFEPLGMKDTDFFVPERKWNRLAALYVPAPGCNAKQQQCRIELAKGPEQDSFKKKPLNLVAGVGQVSTLDDYARFCMMLLNGGQLNGVRVLGRKTVDLMRQDFLGDRRRVPPLNLDEGSGFGLTVAVERASGKTPGLGSEGVYRWYGANGTYFWIDPAEHLFGIFFSQLPFDTTPAPQQFRRMAYAALE